MRIYINIILFLCPSLAVAQVESSSSIIFTATDSTQRQAEGLSLPIDSSDAASSITVTDSYLMYFQASGSNAITFTTPISFTGYAEGMTYVFKAAAANTDSVSININGLGAKRLLNEHFVKLRPGNLQAGNLYKIVYNGTDFMLFSSFDKGCPNAFVEVNSAYCIEINEHPAALYQNASTTCYNLHARICTWGEWYYACKKTTTLGLNAMTNNYEFIDDAHDHGGFVGLVNGTTNCTAFNSLNSITTLNTYRCCYRK